jgi:hypothetical protein
MDELTDDELRELGEALFCIECQGRRERGA